jgi:1-aminocyclopropane-1-carboxylate deaminase
MPDTLPAPVDEVTAFFPNSRGIRIFILRLDVMHPIISGNKWFKLKYNLEAAHNGNFRQVITFGGAYSNHLIATAVASSAAGFSSVGIVRGVHAQQNLTPTMQACRQQGMRLHFVSREAYALRDDTQFLQDIEDLFGNSYIIPEGGNNDAGRKGAGEIADYIHQGATHVCLPVGTGTTFAGLRNRLDVAVGMTGFTAVKNGAYLEDEVARQLNDQQTKNWALETSCHFGGFAKTTPILLDFIRAFHTATGILLDIVYTGKMMFGICGLIERNAFAEGENIVCIHTGGLQGNPVDLSAA